MAALEDHGEMQVRAMIPQLWIALGGDGDRAGLVKVDGQGSLASVFAVSDFAAAAVATAGLAVSEWTEIRSRIVPDVSVDRRLASLWFGFSLSPRGWELPPVWDPIAGDYAAADGWIRLHTNAPHHRAAALRVLGPVADRDAARRLVARWSADELEAAIVAEGGCAAAMRTLRDWATHPQGRAVHAEPVMRMETGTVADSFNDAFEADRPLKTIRVLDLTRVLAGPVATRFLAGFGAEVLRIDPPSWDEGAVIPEITPGKRCAYLDLKTDTDRTRFRDLLSGADILVHGYRSDALEALGLGAAERDAIRPGLIDVSLDAYGWSGPWARRRGFDSLVQMSCGIAEAGMSAAGADRPVPLPVQALDHGAGYLLVAAAVRGLSLRATTGRGSRWRTSLARVGHFLAGFRQSPPMVEIGKPEADDYARMPEATAWGPALRLQPPLHVDTAAMAWDRPAGRLGTSEPAW